MALNTIWRICTSPHTYTANAPTHWAIFPGPKFYFNCSRWWGMESHFGVFLVSGEINHFFIGSESIYTVKAVVWSMFNCTVNILRIDLWHTILCSRNSQICSFQIFPHSIPLSSLKKKLYSYLLTHQVHLFMSLSANKKHHELVAGRLEVATNKTDPSSLSRDQLCVGLGSPTPLHGGPFIILTGSFEKEISFKFGDSQLTVSL